VAGLAVTTAAQTPPTAPAITRAVVTGTKLASLDNTPLYFRAVSVSIPPGQKIGFSARPNGILYQLSGSTEVSAGEPKTITSGGGVLTAGGTTASLAAGNSEQSTLLYFLLVPEEALLEPAAPSLGGGALLYRFGHRREYGRRQDRGPRAGIADLRALRSCAPVGQPRQRAVDLPRLQHQSRRRAGRRPRDTDQTIASERTAWYRPGFVPT
jgi:hypothetical protein